MEKELKFFVHPISLARFFLLLYRSCWGVFKDSEIIPKSPDTGNAAEGKKNTNCFSSAEAFCFIQPE